MTHEAQEITDARSFLEQPGLTITAGSVGLVGEQQAAEVAFGSSPTSIARASKTLATAGWWRAVVEPIYPLQ
jgi:hypothetical protein